MWQASCKKKYHQYFVPFVGSPSALPPAGPGSPLIGSPIFVGSPIPGPVFPYPGIVDGANWATNYDGTADGTTAVVVASASIPGYTIAVLDDTYFLVTYRVSATTTVKLYSRSGVVVTEEDSFVVSSTHDSGTPSIARLSDTKAIITVSASTGASPAASSAWILTISGSPLTISAGTRFDAHTNTLGSGGSFVIPLTADTSILHMMEEAGDYFTQVLTHAGTTITGSSETTLKVAAGAGNSMLSGARLNSTHAACGWIAPGAIGVISVVDDTNTIISHNVSGVSQTATATWLTQSPTLSGGIYQTYFTYPDAATQDPEVAGVQMDSGSSYAITYGTPIDDTASTSSNQWSPHVLTDDGYVLHAYYTSVDQDHRLRIRDFAGNTQSSVVSTTVFDATATVGVRVGAMANQGEDHLLVVISYGTTTTIQVLTHGV